MEPESRPSESAVSTPASASAALDWGMPCPAPGKLNLFLHVTGRRADGYHLLQTVFQLIDLCDTLRFYPSKDGQITMATPTAGVADADNLCVRAALALREAAARPGLGTELGAEIALEKQLPMGAGLGGGSSDAATTLLALNALWKTGLNQSALQAIALRLGADVPVFVAGHSAFAAGVGEELTPIGLPQAWYLLLVPPVHSSTAGIFGSPDLTRETKLIKMADFSAGWEPRFGRFFGRNDLEPVVCAVHPAVARALETLRALAGNDAGVRMSGSGSAVFAVFSTQAKAVAARNRLLNTGELGDKVWVVSGLDTHPLNALLA